MLLCFCVDVHCSTPLPKALLVCLVIERLSQNSGRSKRF